MGRSLEVVCRRLLTVSVADRAAVCDARRPDLGHGSANAIRKLRWTYSADLQAGAFSRTEFQVVVSNWTVTGSGRVYSIAGPGSRRIEDDSTEVVYAGAWTSGSGNFSGGSIHSTTANNASVTCSYTSAQAHSLYLGTRLADKGTTISVSVDGQGAIPINLNVPTEDVLIEMRSSASFHPGIIASPRLRQARTGHIFTLIFWKSRFQPAIFQPNRSRPSSRWPPTGTRTLSGPRARAYRLDDRQSGLPRPGESL